MLVKVSGETEGELISARTESGRGRPRSEQCHASIVDSVLSLLEREGYGALTIEGVARHARVGKQSIYRRWRSKAELVLEAYASHVEAKVPIPDRGSVREDLRVFLGTALRRLNQISGPIMRGLMADAVHDADFNRLLREVFLAKRRQSIRQILERAIRRGELRADADTELMLDLLFGPIWYRLLSQHGKLDARFATGLCDALLRGFGTHDGAALLPLAATAKKASRGAEKRAMHAASGRRGRGVILPNK